jgi:hypothetical protein
MTIFIRKLSALLEAGNGDVPKGPFVNLDTTKGVSFSSDRLRARTSGDLR